MPLSQRRFPVCEHVILCALLIPGQAEHRQALSPWESRSKHEKVYNPCLKARRVIDIQCATIASLITSSSSRGALLRTKTVR